MQNFFLFLLAIPFFFAVNRYNGIIIDGPLYVLQVINSMFPERFVGDIAFAYGNQDSFSLFTPLYRFFILQFGVEAGSRILCFFLQTGFAFAWAFCIKVFWEKCIKGVFPSIRTMYLFGTVSNMLNSIYFPIMLCLLCMGMYAFGTPLSQTEFLRFVEGYAVSRLPSIAFGIAGIAFLIAGKKYASFILFLMGSLMHPLMAGWGLPMWMFVYYPKSIRFIVAGSILLPLTIFADKIPFAGYPEGWLTRPFNFAPTYDDIAKFISFIAFFGICAKHLQNADVRNISRAVAIIVSIALYWWMWGGLAHHIFLYQVQCFRIEWICMVLIVPFFMLMLLNRYQHYCIKHIFSTHDFALIAFAIALFLPMHLLEFATLGTVLFLRRERSLSSRIPQIVFLLTSLLALCYQTYLRLGLEGMPLIILRNLSDAYRIADTLIMAECILAVIVAIHMVRKRRFVLFVALIMICIFPSFQLLPLFVCYAWMQPNLNRKKVFVLLLIAGVEGILNYDIRISRVAYPGPLALVFALWVTFVISLAISRLISHSSFARAIPLILFSFGTAAYAYANWDSRPEEMILSEKQIDDFVNKDIFENEGIVDRGRVFYHVNGFAACMPRLQFLNGGYYDENSLTGALFFEGQYRDGNHRRNMLLLKRDDGTQSDYASYRNFANGILSKRDSLMDRVEFLCRENEITHFVTDLDGLTQSPLKSFYLNVLQKKVFLYSCNDL